MVLGIIATPPRAKLISGLSSGHKWARVDI